MKIIGKQSYVPLVVVLAALSLSGCGGAPASPPGEAENPPAPVEETDAPAPEEPVGDDAPPNDAGGAKPSKQEVVDGYLSIAGQTLGTEASPEELEVLVPCVVDKIYDTVAPKTLRAMADKKIWEMDQDDFSAIFDASVACTDELGM